MLGSEDNILLKVYVAIKPLLPSPVGFSVDNVPYLETF
jgi:hypothetical protein